MLKPVMIVLIVLFAGALAYVASRPDSFHIERQILINAAPERIFPLINDLHSWTEWSPYEMRDPQMKRSYSGSAAGKGAIYEWDGNDNVGKGRMEILESAPLKQVLIKLDFLKPFEGHNRADLTLEPIESGTKVTWAMSGSSNFMTKVIGCFIDMDTMIGKDFSEGLSKMKQKVESEKHG
ncbi:MAG: SRPBCC family protein [Candidatus Obscuribacterales bacterium]|nr:SRPBCC family protein [Candidatus Obscuribacterales bacterium]